MAPVACHDKVGQVFPNARRKLALFQLFWKGIGIAGIADRDGGDGLPVVRDVEDFARFVSV